MTSLSDCLYICTRSHMSKPNHAVKFVSVGTREKQTGKKIFENRKDTLAAAAKRLFSRGWVVKNRFVSGDRPGRVRRDAYTFPPEETRLTVGRGQDELRQKKKKTKNKKKRKKKKTPLVPTSTATTVATRGVRQGGGKSDGPGRKSFVRNEKKIKKKRTKKQKVLENSNRIFIMQVRLGICRRYIAYIM